MLRRLNVLIAVSVRASAAAADVPHVQNGDTPRDGMESTQYLVRCDLDDEGFVYAVADRNAYRIDVFDPDGASVRRVAVAVPGDPKEDRLYLLPGHQLALVRGAVQARRNTFGGSRGEEAEAPVHDLTLYAY